MLNIAECYNIIQKANQKQTLFLYEWGGFDTIVEYILLKPRQCRQC